MDNEYRYEIKYKIHHNQNLLLENWLSTKINKATIYEPRWNNTIYYDTTDLSSAEDNLSGYSDRVKYRVRWYGNNLISQKLNIEYKIKKNKLSYKKIFKSNLKLNDLVSINPFNLNFYNKENEDDKEFVFNILGSRNYYPIIQIKYLRQYFYYDKIRITVDKKLDYKLYNNKNFSSSDDNIILELKTNEKNLINLKNLISKIPFMVTRNSKYLTGLNACKKANFYF